MITIQQVHKYLDVDTINGTVVWKHHDQRPDRIGQACGWMNNGYCRMALFGYQFYRCQLIWFVEYGEWPTDTIDHADGDPANDRVDNLRLATKGQNATNSKMNVRNTSGFKGVSFCRQTQRWRASIRVNGKEVNLGRYDTPEEAHEVWRTVAIAVFGEEFVRA